MVELAKKSGMYYFDRKIDDVRRCTFKAGTVLAQVWTEVMRNGPKADLSFLEAEPSKKDDVKETSN